MYCTYSHLKDRLNLKKRVDCTNLSRALIRSECSLKYEPFEVVFTELEVLILTSIIFQ